MYGRTTTISPRWLIAGMFAFLALFAPRIWAGTGSAGDTDCDPGVKVKGTMYITHNSPNGEPATDFHFYVYQNDRDSVVVQGASISSSDFGTVEVELGSDDGTDDPPPGNHGAQVNMCGGSVPDGARIAIQIEMCLNERNCLKFKDIQWTYDGDCDEGESEGVAEGSAEGGAEGGSEGGSEGNAEGTIEGGGEGSGDGEGGFEGFFEGEPPAPNPFGCAGGWRIYRPFPGGNGGVRPEVDAGGNGQGAQEGDGGSGNFVHIVCIENDDPDNCMVLLELKLLASMTDYATPDLIDWDSIDPIVDKDCAPPIVIPPGGKYCYYLNTTGSYLDGHVYINHVTYCLPCDQVPPYPFDPPIAKGDNPDDWTTQVIGDHPVDDLDGDASGDDVADSFYEANDLPFDTDLSETDTDLDNLPLRREFDLLTNPNDGNDPPLVIGPGALTLEITETFAINIGLSGMFTVPGELLGGIGPIETEVTLMPAPLGLLGSLECGIGTDLSNTDLLIKLPTGLALPNIGDTMEIPFDLSTAPLLNAEPIVVPQAGGEGEGVAKLFNIDLVASPLFSPAGQLVLTRTSGSGGIANLIFQIFPLMTFIDVDSGDEVTYVPGPAEVSPTGSTFILQDFPWEFVVPNFDCPECGAGFRLGFDDDTRQGDTVQSLDGLVQFGLQPACVDDFVPGPGDRLGGYGGIYDVTNGELTFGRGGVPPIPADFFGPGSLPFEGVVQLAGGSLDFLPCALSTPPFGDLILNIRGPVRIGEPASTATVPIEIQALDLVSAQPIVVDVAGQPTLYDVFVDLGTGDDESSGLATINSDAGADGPAELDLSLIPRIMFRETDEPSGPLLELSSEFDLVALDLSSGADLIHINPNEVIPIPPENCESDLAFTSLSGSSKSLAPGGFRLKGPGGFLDLRLSGLPVPEGEGEGVVEGEGEGIVEGEGEGVTEGEGEGVVEGEGEGSVEGDGEGVPEGDGEGDGEGTVEGEGEGSEEGSVEGVMEGEGEGELLECGGIVPIGNGGFEEGGPFQPPPGWDIDLSDSDDATAAVCDSTCGFTVIEGSQSLALQLNFVSSFAVASRTIDVPPDTESVSLNYQAIVHEIDGTRDTRLQTSLNGQTLSDIGLGSVTLDSFFDVFVELDLPSDKGGANQVQLEVKLLTTETASNIDLVFVDDFTLSTTCVGEGEGTAEGEGSVEGEGEPDAICTETLDEVQERPTPDPTTGATGTATFTPIGGDMVRLMVTHDVVNPTMAHIHAGAPGVIGGVVLNLGSPVSPIVVDLTEAQYETFRTGHYINVHSQANSSGQIRGDLDCPPLGTEGEGSGDGEGTTDGEGAVEGEENARSVLSDFGSADSNMDGRLDFTEFSATYSLPQEIFDALDTNDDGELSVAELQRQVADDKPLHNADQNGDGKIDLSELLRVIQFYNARGYDCTIDPDDSEDGFDIDPDKGLSPECTPHAGDYSPADGSFSLSELLRLIQLYNLRDIGSCPGQSEDGFCLNEK